MRTILLAVLFATLVGCGAVEEPPPFYLQLPANTTAEQRAMLQAAATEWNEALGEQPFSLEPCRGCSLVPVSYFPAPVPPVGHVGIVIPTPDGWELKLSVIATQVDMVHELGHLLHLGHSDDQHSVMYPEVVAVEQAIGEDEVAWVRARFYE